MDKEIQKIQDDFGYEDDVDFTEEDFLDALDD